MESKQPITENTIFEIGSLSKLFTSLLLADSANRGEVDLDEPVQSVFGDLVHLPTDGQTEITWRSLANHRSSLPRLPDDLLSTADLENPYVHYDEQRLYACLNRMDALTPIGSKFEYSNFGVGLLGHALGKVVGTNYHSALKDRILKPLGLCNTFTESEQTPNEHFATSHKKKNSPSQHWDFTEATVAAGGIRSTLTDMLSFLRANVCLPNTNIGEAIIKMREPSDLPLPNQSNPKFSLSDYIIPYSVVIGMLCLFSLILLQIQWRNEFNPGEFMFAPFLLAIFVATFHCGANIGILATLAFSFLLPGYFFSGFGGIPEIIWSAVYIFFRSHLENVVDLSRRR